MFALTWSFGCTTNLAGRDKFNAKFKKMLPSKVNFPDDASVYDVMFDIGKKEWVRWGDTVQEYSADAKNAYSEIVVPTFDSIRMQYVTRILLTNKKHVLCPGPTGTGKTVNISMLLAAGLPDEYQYIPITFSA